MCFDGPKKTFEEVGYFDDSMRRVEDADFAIRLDLIGGAFIGTRKIGFEQLATHAPDKSPEKTSRQRSCSHKKIKVI